MFEKIGLIGTGNMGSAVAKAVAKSPACGQLFFANRTREKAENLAREIGKGQVVENRLIAETCDLIIIGVKPQGIDALMDDLRPILAKRKGEFVLVSMVAGVSCKTVSELSGADAPVMQIMPNTPIVTGSGVVLYCPYNVSAEQEKELLALLEPAGFVDRVSENEIAAAETVTGCGPAWAYMFVDALADGAVACGLSRAKAIAYAAKMLEGSAKLVAESGKHPDALKDAVCSPGGTTIQGVRALEANGFRSAVMEAVIAAEEKFRSLH